MDGELMCQDRSAEMDKDRAYDEFHDEWCMLLLDPIQPNEEFE